MRRPSGSEIEHTLKMHRRWVRGDGGECANLSYCDLSWMDLGHTCLRFAILHHSNLAYANLTGADLSNACLSAANLSDANLTGASLTSADLSQASLWSTNINRADLTGADISNAYIAHMRNATLFLASTEIVPREGSFVGWKRCAEEVLVKIRITEDSLRSNATGRKCRASKVEVLEMSRNGNPVEEASSMFDTGFKYHIGDVIEVNDFDENRFNECSTGIHFFLTPTEAMAY